MKKERATSHYITHLSKEPLVEKKKIIIKKWIYGLLGKKKKKKKTTDVMRGNFKGIKIESFYFLEI